jgi:D-amino-acid oxidase
MERQADIAVIGGGIIGLLTAAEAIQRGYTVNIYSDRKIETTTSWKAAACFKPHSVFYSDTTHVLVEESWTAWERYLHDYGESTGIRMHTHWEAMSRKPEESPRYLSVVRNPRVREYPHVPGGYQHAWKYETFFIDMPVFLLWLVRKLARSRSAEFYDRSFRSLEEVAAVPASAIVNATGYGAKELTSDPDLIADKGQAAILDLDLRQAMDWSISADGFYIYPRGDETMLGGTDEMGVTNERIDEVVIELLINGNKRVLPAIHRGNIKRCIAGIRPYRQTGQRIEIEVISGKRIVHNYGHGGSGVTLAPGSALAALDLFSAI